MAPNTKQCHIPGEKRADEALIICNNYPVGVRQNLKSAVQHLRVDKPRTLWLDRLCIDQENQEEKSWQVSMMGDIFSFASRVLLWLGQPAANDYLPIDLVKCFCERMFDPARYPNGYKMDELEKLTNQDLLDNFDIPMPDAEVWQMMDRILANP